MRYLLTLLFVLLFAASGQAAPGDTSVGFVPIISAAAEGSHVLKAAPGNLYSVYYTNTTGATAGFLITLNATAVPADGAVTPVECVQVPVTATGGISFVGSPEAYSTGIVAVFTTAATCFTKTTGVATGFFHATVF